MKRILFMVLRNILYVPFAWIRLCYYASHVDKYSEEKRFLILKDICAHANKGGRVTIKPYGLENIPKESGYMYYPNHQGLFDVLSMVSVCDTPFSVVAKKEIADVPFLKQVFSCMKAYSLDREDVKQAMKVIVNVAEEVKSGRNYLIFAEGTRTRNKNELLEFKGGSFKCATRAKCPIVPVALIDSYKSFDTNSIKPITVQVHFLKPLYYDDYKDMKSTEIAKYVHDEIEKIIKENE